MFKIECTHDLLKLNKEYPKRYIDVINRVVNKMVYLFEDNLLSIILGGSCGNGDIIEGFSDVELYVVLNRFDVKNISKISKYILLEEETVLISYYLKDEVINNMIDSKTKVTLYEKDKYNVNPTLYGKNVFKTVTYKDIKKNDENVLPTVLHDVRRKYMYLYSNKDIKVDKSFIYNLTVLLKCILNHNDIFTYGYKETFDKFKLLYELKVNNDYRIIGFDILEVINDLDNSKDKVLEFCNTLFELSEGILISSTE